MPQLHCYVPDAVAQKVQRRAAAAGVSTSRYLADLIKERVGADWPAGYFEKVVGGWQGEPLERPAQGEFESRDLLG